VGGDQRPLGTEPIADALETESPDDIESPLAAAFRRFADSTGADRFALAAHTRSRNGETTNVESITVPTLILAGDADQLAGSPEELANRIPGHVSDTAGQSPERGARSSVHSVDRDVRELDVIVKHHLGRELAQCPLAREFVVTQRLRERAHDRKDLFADVATGLRGVIPVLWS